MFSITDNRLSFEELIEQLPREIVEVFARALEFGIWPSGQVLTPAQKQICSEVLISKNYVFNFDALN